MDDRKRTRDTVEGGRGKEEGGGSCEEARRNGKDHLKDPPVTGSIII
jgi:hypothetical protein